MTHTVRMRTCPSKRGIPRASHPSEDQEPLPVNMEGMVHGMIRFHLVHEPDLDLIADAEAPIDIRVRSRRHVLGELSTLGSDDFVLEPAQPLDLTLDDIAGVEVLGRVHREPDTMGSAGQDHVAGLERHAARQVVDEVSD
jgi:hypothetical protein